MYITPQIIETNFLCVLYTKIPKQYEPSFVFATVVSVVLNMNSNDMKADLLARYGGVAPKMAEQAHAQVIDQVQNLDMSMLPMIFNPSLCFLFSL